MVGGFGGDVGFGFVVCWVCGCGFGVCFCGWFGVVLGGFFGVGGMWFVGGVFGLIYFFFCLV